MRYFTPVAAENMMAEMRRERGFVEKQAVDTIVCAVNGTSDAVKKHITVVNPLAIHIPTWQRNIDINRVNDIAENYNDLMFENVKVIILDGKLYAIEGQHRTLGTAKRGMVSIPVEVLKCDESEARNLFLMQGIKRKNPSIADVWRVSIANGDPLHLKVKEICKKHNFEIAYDDEVLENPVAVIKSVADFTGSVGRPRSRATLETFERILVLLTKLTWCASETGKGSSNGIIRALESMYAHTNKEDYERMENALIEELGTVQKFESEVLAKSWRYYFDAMADAVNRNLNSNVVNKFSVKSKSKVA